MHSHDRQQSAPAAPPRQLTSAPHGHVLTNANVWSPDSRWIVYDVRPDPAGSRFEGERIEMVHVETGEVRVLYECVNDARCGVATFSPATDEVAFILGPEHPSADWSYCAWHRGGVMVRVDQPGKGRRLDARDIMPPFTPGALRGGTHVHVFSGDGQWVSYTYDDHVLATREPGAAAGEADINQRNIGVSVPSGGVIVPRTHERNHDGSHFSVLVTRTHREPRPGSDEIQRAFEEAWVGAHGYIRADGARQNRAFAFQGEILTAEGEAISEVFIVDMPDDVTRPGEGPLEGTLSQRPAPPLGAVQRRLTFTDYRRYPGIQGPRHWLRSSPDGERIAFLMKDDEGVVQLWTVSPRGGPAAQLTRQPWGVASAFTWSPDGRSIACVMDASVFQVDAASGDVERLSERSEASPPRPEACVFSPDGSMIAFARTVQAEGQAWNQVFVVASSPA